MIDPDHRALTLPMWAGSNPFEGKIDPHSLRGLAQDPHPQAGVDGAEFVQRRQWILQISLLRTLAIRPGPPQEVAHLGIARL